MDAGKSASTRKETVMLMQFFDGFALTHLLVLIALAALWVGVTTSTPAAKRGTTIDDLDLG